MMTADRRETGDFSAGLSMPWKIFRSRTAIEGRPRPEHIRLYPTNRCNAACSFCAIRKWTRGEEIPTPELMELVRHFHRLGTRAITVSGGGEPTLHPGFDALLDLAGELDIQLGLITNGLLWSDAPKKLPANGRLVWARMSVVDSESGNYDVGRLRRFSRNLSETAVGCYATITSRSSVDTIRALADLAEELPNVTHFKLGEDTVSGAGEKMSELADLLKPGHGKVIVHRHEGAVRGAKRCLVSLVRPVAAADGYVYPCCSMELEDLGQVRPDRFRMTRWRDFGADTGCFDGSICPKCIWDRYNRVLAALCAPMEHERFF
ncbi:MAG: radical SAM protein [Planctomycetota bacterium]|jgi:MoaA/NifB/PqqE/SkfB family radical SAM enzyme|nr:radical SAM protein [Planctomycetota bacterium]